jgi:alpha-1,4-N-acetylglucosaminyltransferase EXTL3
VIFQVLKSPANSLNKRFLPFNVIETDAIFSMDDDMDVDQAMIVQGFR